MLASAVVASLASAGASTERGHAGGHSHASTSNADASAHKHWHYTRDGHLFATLDVLDGFDENHQLIALRNATSIWLDIGINTEPSALPGRTFAGYGRRAFYLGFEPLLDKYAHNLARGVRGIVRSPLGKFSLPASGSGGGTRHALMTPFAVADNNNQPATFNIANIDGCASLGKIVDANKLNGWDGVLSGIRKGCGTTAEQRTVPTITLETILTEWLGGQTIAFMHVDVQGSEMSVIRSARQHIRQVERVMLEVPTGACTALTEGSPTCDETLAMMHTLGFVAEEAFCTNHGGEAAQLQRGFTCSQIPRHGEWTRYCKCETDILLVRTDVSSRWQDTDHRLGLKGGMKGDANTRSRSRR